MIELLRELRSLNGESEYVFASPRDLNQPISSHAMIQVVYRMGFKNRATIHGFRSTASTYLNESGYNYDAVERQLAHAEKNQVRAAYNRSQYLDERKRLLCGWSDYVYSITNAVTPIDSITI